MKNIIPIFIAILVACMLLTGCMYKKPIYNIDIIVEVLEGDVSGTKNILGERLLQLGISEDDMKFDVVENRIYISLTSKTNKEDRFINIISLRGELGFWETYNIGEIYMGMMAANDIIKNHVEENDPVQESMPGSEVTGKDIIEKNTDIETVADNSGENEAIDAILSEIEEQGGATEKLGETEVEDLEKQFPLFTVLTPNIRQDGSIPKAAEIGFAEMKDTATVNRYLQMPEVKTQFPKDLVFKWSALPVGYRYGDTNSQSLQLYALKGKGTNGYPAMSGNVITEAIPEIDRQGSFGVINISMDEEGARQWLELTKNNIGRALAMVIDGRVYSAPIVQSQIEGGRSMITGGFSYTEAKDLAIVLATAPEAGKIGQVRVVKIEVGKAGK